MEDRDTGAGAPEVGASSASPLQGSGSPSAGRHHRRPGEHRQSGRHAGAGQQADDASQNQKGKPKKRRKRRRGRKVFARDEAKLGANGSPPSRDHAVSADPSRGKPVAVLPAIAAIRVEQAERRPPMPELPVFAALDLGTNNCRLLVAVPTRHGQFRVIDAFSRIVRLGEGLTANGRLGQPAMDRAVEALKILSLIHI